MILFPEDASQDRKVCGQTLDNCRTSLADEDGDAVSFPVAAISQVSGCVNISVISSSIYSIITD